MKSTIKAIVTCAVVAYATFGFGAWKTQKVGDYTYTYSLNQYDGTTGASIVGVDPEPTGKLYIPSELGTYSVRSVGQSALEDCKNLTEVVLPFSLTTIGRWAFAGCTSLTRITIPDGVKTVYDEPFLGCSNLAKVDMPSSLDGVVSEGETFPGCRWNLTLYYREKVDGVTFYYYEPGITGGAGTAWIGFGDAPAISPTTITSVEIPSELNGRPVQRIDDHSFKGCYSMKSVSIPDGVASIGVDVFEGCTSLCEVEYLGGRPSAPNNLYGDTPDNLVSYVPSGSDSWAAALTDGTWCERDIQAKDPLALDAWDASDGSAAYGTLIEPGTAVRSHGDHSLSAIDSYDFFRIYMTAGRTYVLETVGSGVVDMFGEPLNTYGELFDSTSTIQENIVVSDDDSGDGYNFRIEFTPTASQTYYLRVRSVSGCQYGVYSLKFSYSFPPDAWDPADDVASDGTLIMPTGEVWSHGTHTLSSTDKYDYFRVSMTAGRKYVLESTGSFDLAAALYNAPSTSSSAVVATDDNSGGGSNFRIEYTPTATQTYYLRVRHSSVGNAASYDLQYSYAATQEDSYTVRFHKYDGSGATADQVFKVGETKNLLWKDSDLKWSNSGYTFVGWVPWDPDKANCILCKYANGEKVKDLGKAGEVVHLYAGWKSSYRYQVCFNRNDGTGATMIQVMLRDKDIALAWKDSQIGWTRAGYSFKGWAESASGAVKYANGAKVKNLAAAGATKQLYAVWTADQSTYTVRFNKNDESGATKDQTFKVGETKNLLWKDSELKWSRDGYTFKGWAESASGAVKYSNGQSVKDIASAGATKNLYAIWQSNQATYTVRFHKYDGSGATADQVFKVGETKSLLWKDSELKWSNPGYTFVGWVPWDPDGKNCILCKYVNGEKVTDLGKAGEVVHLYAGWKSSYRYQVCFNKNDGTGATMIQVMPRDKDVGLAWKDSQIGWTRAGYTFKGWAESASGSVKYANGETVKNLAAANATKQLYAVWTKADSASATPRVRAAAVAAPKPVVPEWAVGTFYGWDGDSFATVTVSAGGEVSGLVLFENDTWTIEGVAEGFCIDAEVVDEAGNSRPMVLWLSLDDDGHVVIESDGGSIRMVN